MTPLGCSGWAQLRPMVESVTSPMVTLMGFPGTREERTILRIMRGKHLNQGVGRDREAESRCQSHQGTQWAYPRLCFQFRWQRLERFALPKRRWSDRSKTTSDSSSSPQTRPKPLSSYCAENSRIYVSFLRRKQSKKHNDNFLPTRPAPPISFFNRCRLLLPSGVRFLHFIV